MCEPIRLALTSETARHPRVHNACTGQGVMAGGVGRHGTVEKSTELTSTKALDKDLRVRPGREIGLCGGLAEVTIGETLADPDDPIALWAITVDEHWP